MSGNESAPVVTIVLSPEEQRKLDLAFTLSHVVARGQSGLLLSSADESSSLVDLILQTEDDKVNTEKEEV